MGLLALGGVWLALASLGLAVVMVVIRPAMTDLTVTLVLYFGSPGALCFGGLVLWAHRKDEAPEAGVLAQRLQAKVAVALAIVAAAIVYGLVIGAEEIPLIDAEQAAFYNPTHNDVTRTQPTMQTMRITVNGQPETLDEELTVADLLARRDLQPVRVAVEINEELVPRAAFCETAVRSGDCVEIVTFVGGG